MNANNLLDVIGQAKETYILAAVNTCYETKERKHKRLSLRKGLLIAAVIALMLLMVGCVAYVLRLQDMKIAETAYSRDFDDHGRFVEPTEVNRDVISLRGYPGSPNYLATKEWYEFVQSYDPDGALAGENDENPLNIPEEYMHPYGCYTWEMVEKVDGIAEKYSLKLLSAGTTVQRYQIDVMFEALGIEGVCCEEKAARVSGGAGYFYPEGNFTYAFEFLLEQDGSNWPYEIWASMLYSRKDYFDPGLLTMQIDQTEQWDYTTSNGTNVLIAMYEGGAFLFAEQEEAYVTVILDTETMLSAGETRRPTKADIERAAEVINFSIRTQEPDMTGMEEKLAQAEKEYQEAQEAARQKAAEGHATYAAYIKEKYIDGADALAGTPYMRNYYALVDVTGDGVDELLLGSEDDHFRDLLTVQDGKVATILFWSHMNLCEGNIIDIMGTRGESVEHGYYAIEGDMMVQPLEEVDYDAVSDVWYHGTGVENPEYLPITEEEAREIMGKYVYVDIEMKPISAFPLNEN